MAITKILLCIGKKTNALLPKAEGEIRGTTSYSPPKRPQRENPLRAIGRTRLPLLPFQESRSEGYWAQNSLPPFTGRRLSEKKQMGLLGFILALI
jgi:hypothetical protein